MRLEKNVVWSTILLAAVLAAALGVARAQEESAAPATAPAAQAAAPVSQATGQPSAPDIRSQEGAKAASSAGGENAASGLKGVLAVTLIIWVGLFAYVYRLDRKVRRLEVS